jgi:hypothetical protein
MGVFDNIAATLSRVHGISPAAASAAVALAVKAHQGHAPSRATANRIAQSPKGKAILTSALAALQTHPSFWTSHYVTSYSTGRAAPRYVTGDMFGDIAKAASSAVQSVAHDISQVVSDPGKALAKAASDIVKNPAGVLSEVVQKAVNAALPVDLLKPIPGIGDLAQLAKSYSPVTTLGKLATSALRGDLKGVVGVAKGELDKLQSVASMVPGLGTGVSSAIGAAEALMSGGNPIEVALRAAYGAIPIPPGLRNITDTVLDAVLALLHGGNVSDIALTVARDRIPEGLPRDVFDTLAQIVVRHTPIAQAAGELAQHEALKLAQGAGPAILQGLAKSVPAGAAGLLSKLPDPSKVLGGLPPNVMGVAGLLGKLPAGPLQKQAAALVAPLAKAQADRQAAMNAAKAQIHKAIAVKLPAVPVASRVLPMKRVIPLHGIAAPAAPAPALGNPMAVYDMFLGIH